MKTPLITPLSIDRAYRLLYEIHAKAPLNHETSLILWEQLINDRVFEQGGRQLWSLYTEDSSK
jgi:hypothetical protein